VTDAAGHLDVAAALHETAALHPREVVHAFKASVLAASAAELGDDASVLCIDWHGSDSPDPGDEQSATGSRPAPAAANLDAA